MSKLIIVQAGQTEWEFEGRLDPLAGSPLSDAGRESVISIAEEVAGTCPVVVYSSDGQAEQASARIIAERAGVRARVDNHLCEIDYGLWQGLKTDEIKRRQPRLQKQWLESPSGVRPPGGEILAEAQDRVWSGILGLVKKHKNDTIALVIRPLVLGLLRCRVLKLDLADVWTQTSEHARWFGIEVNHENPNDIVFTIGASDD